MGAIAATLDVPGNADPQRVYIYTQIYSWLALNGYTAPGFPANTITQAQLVAYLQSTIGPRIKTEILTDPANLGYAGASGAVANSLNTVSNVRASRRSSRRGQFSWRARS